ncbi:hypothetical protein QR680_006001 [Steinernema hermaphroditum]|nr:hypothetical protein QR680_006001 [Steinernema hermaphroditum]
MEEADKESGSRWIRAFLSFVALQNLGTTLQCLLDCGQFAPNLSYALCRQISALNLVLFFVRIHTVFAVEQKASHALNSAVCVAHLISIFYDLPLKITPALSLQVVFSGVAAFLSVYAWIYCCQSDQNPSRREKTKEKNPGAMFRHLRPRAKNKDL